MKSRPAAGVAPRVSALTARLGRRGPGDFLRGFALPFRALAVVAGSPRLVALSALSAAVTVATLAVVLVGVGHLAPGLVGWIWERPEAWYLVWLWYLLAALTFVLLAVVGAATLPALALTPLQDPISEATEALCGGAPPPPFSAGRLLRSAAVSLGHTLSRVALLLAGHLLLFALNLIPAVGSAAWSVLGTAWTMLWLTGEYVGGPMTRHLYAFGQLPRVLLRRFALSMGFGAAVWLLMWVPLLNLLFVPLAITAGTLLYRGLLEGSDLPPPPEPA